MRSVHVDGYPDIQIPDEMLPDQALSLINQGIQAGQIKPLSVAAPSLSIGQDFTEGLKGIGSGALSALPKAGAGIAGLLGASGTHDYLKGLATSAEGLFPAAPGTEGSTARSVGESVGSFLPGAAVSLIPGVGPMAGLATFGAQGFGQGVESTRGAIEQARKAGLDVGSGTETGAELLGGTVGAGMSMIPGEQLVGRGITGMLGPAAAKALTRNFATRTLTQAGLMATIGTLGTEADRQIRKMYDPRDSTNEPSLYDVAKQNATVGGIANLLIGELTHSIAAKQAARANRPPSYSTTAPSMPPSEGMALDAFDPLLYPQIAGRETVPQNLERGAPLRAAEEIAGPGNIRVMPTEISDEPIKSARESAQTFMEPREQGVFPEAGPGNYRGPETPIMGVPRPEDLPISVPRPLAADEAGTTLDPLATINPAAEHVAEPVVEPIPEVVKPELPEAPLPDQFALGRQQVDQGTPDHPLPERKLETEGEIPEQPGVYSAGKRNLDPEFVKQALPALNRIRTITDAMGFRDVGVRIADSIYSPKGEPIDAPAHAPVGMRMIELAMDPRIEGGRLDPEIAHELFHVSEDLGLVTPKELKLVDQAATRHGYDQTVPQKYQEAHDRGEIPQLPANMAKEVRGNYIQDAYEYRQLKNAGEEIPDRLKVFQPATPQNGILNRVFGFVDKVRNAMRGAGFDTFENFMNRFESGETGRGQRNYANQQLPAGLPGASDPQQQTEETASPAKTQTQDFGKPIDESLVGEQGPDQFALKRKPETFPSPAHEALDKKIYAEPDERSPYRKALESIPGSSTGEQLNNFATMVRQAFLNKHEALLRNQIKTGRTTADVSAFAAAEQAHQAAGVAGRAVIGGGAVHYHDGYTEANPKLGKPLLSEKGDGSGILDEVFKDNNFRKWATYMAANRAERLAGEGREHLMTPADIALGKSYELQHPYFKQTAAEYRDFNNHLLDFLKDTGYLTPEQVDVWKKNDYFPFYRDIADADARSPVGPREMGQAFANLPSLKKLKGQDAKIGDPLVNMIKNVSALTSLGMRNVAAQRALRDSVDLGYAKQVPYGTSGPDVVDVRVGGKKLKYQVTDQLTYDSVMASGVGVPEWLRASGIPATANFVRKAATMAPTFILRHAFRSNAHDWVIGGTDKLPPAAILDGATQAIRKSATFEKLLNTGAMGSTILNEGPTSEHVAKSIRRKMTQLYPGTSEGSGWFQRLKDLSEEGVQKSDILSRINVYDAAMRRTKGNEAQALFEAVDSMPYSRHGSSVPMRALSAMVPFLNAHMQGLDVMYRTATGRGRGGGPLARDAQMTLLRRAGIMMGAASVYAAFAPGIKAWQNASPEERDGNMFIPLPDGGAIRIPVPFEAGILKIFPERVMSWALGHDRATGKDFMEAMERYLGGTLGLVTLPAALKPLVENMANHDFGTARQIEPDTVQKLEPFDRWDDHTSETAKAAGHALNASPMKIDHLIRGYTATSGMIVSSLLDAMINPLKASGHPDYTLYNMPGIGSLFQRPDGAGNLIEYYETRDAATKAVATLKDLSVRSPQGAESYGKSREKELAVAPLTDEVSHKLTELHAMRKAVMNAPTSMLSGTAKRQALDQIRQEEIEYAGQANKVVRVVGVK